IAEAMEQELVTVPNSDVTLGAVKRRMQELEEEFANLLRSASCGSGQDYRERFQAITEETARLKAQQEDISAQLRTNQSIRSKMQRITAAASQMEHQMTEWDEAMIRQLVHTVEVISADRIRVILTDGSIIMQEVHSESGTVSKGNGECFLTEDIHTSLSTGGGQAGQGYPCVLCLNDQGGQFMSCSENITGTLRSQMNQHQPLILESNQEHAKVRTDGVTPTLAASMGMGGGYVPMVYENHGIDSRYTGPHKVSPTILARCGTGGNNVPLVGQSPDVYCIVGNAIDRQPQNGGNGLGYQEDLSYTLTAMDRHAIFSRQRTDAFQESQVVSTESARQHKDATDLVMQPYQDTVGTLVRSDHKGISSQYVSDDKCIVNEVNLIRRLTPLACERLQGFPDGWTNIPSASDSARYKALGNSVAIPCVEFVMKGVATYLKYENAKHRRRRGWLARPSLLMAA
ncbi:MAG: DNA cytosine methyltransferase, partial [Oscillospiraceae bacterium]|nr:DNA cytosine methyltransferase [Oscillospiraceae bacterium]